MKEIYSTRSFINRVVLILIALAVFLSALVILFVYLPFRNELKKSLIDNFSQLSYIRYDSLHNDIDRGLEGARSLSSRTVIRDAIVQYLNGEMDIDELSFFTQSKYEDGAKALKYLVRTERYVDDTVIARYQVEDSQAQLCSAIAHIEQKDEIFYKLCLEEESHDLFIISSPIYEDGAKIGQDILIFDLSSQIHALCTPMIKSELVSDITFDLLYKGAELVREDENSVIFIQNGYYYRAFKTTEDSHFIVSQAKSNLIEPIHRQSRQILAVGIGLLIAFTLGVYLFVIRFAKNQLDNSHQSLKGAMAEANTDPLTKAGSRRFGEKYLTEAFDAFKLGNPTPCIMLFDIDLLKKINDIHGHSAGDVVIRSVAEAVQSNFNENDILLRWGGDEFIAIVSGINRDVCKSFAKNILHSVESLKIQSEVGVISPTISIGISSFYESDISFINVINRADYAMYISKKDGRNQINEL